MGFDRIGQCASATTCSSLTLNACPFEIVLRSIDYATGSRRSILYTRLPLSLASYAYVRLSLICHTLSLSPLRSCHNRSFTLYPILYYRDSSTLPDFIVSSTLPTCLSVFLHLHLQMYIYLFPYVILTQRVSLRIHLSPINRQLYNLHLDHTRPLDSIRQLPFP